MNTAPWTCETCNKKYKTLGGYKKHKCTIRRIDNQKTTLRKKKNRISPQVRFEVRKTYIGNQIEAKCFCCYKNTITPFTNCNTFHAGHIKSEANGGEIKIENLLPICSDCNKSMGAVNWDEYIKLYTNFRVRLYGANIPFETNEKIIKIQRFYKRYKTRKQCKKRSKKKNKKIPNYLKPTESFINKKVGKFYHR